ncbi:hypothetical protein EB151_11250 [archaeon]|jgi:hypothetical protein|nr:hypothetical protein [archaeon]
MNNISKMFKKYRKGCSYFIETGTYKGYGIDAAKDVGFEKYYSAEYLTSLYKECLEKFKDHDDIFLYNGSSEDCLESFLDEVDKRSLFWLDAHDSFGTGGGVPTFEELKIIKEHPIKNHTLLIDDIPLYFGDGQELKERILEINTKYKFKTHDPDTRPDYILVAYIDE